MDNKGKIQNSIGNFPKQHNFHADCVRLDKPAKCYQVFLFLVAGGSFHSTFRC